MALEPECVPLDGTWSMLVRSRLVFDWWVADKFLRGSLTSLGLLVWIGEEWNPKDRERESHPCVNLHREIKLIGTNVWLPKIEFLLMLISSLPDLLQNKSLETILIFNVVLCFPHNNIACIHMCDECMQSNVPIVCHMLLSISSPHEQVCSQTTKYQVFNTCQSIDISEQSVSKQVDNSLTDWFSSSFNWWSSMHCVATLKNCWVVFICKFEICFHVFLCMTFHVTGPRRYCFCIKFPWSTGR